MQVRSHPGDRTETTCRSIGRIATLVLVLGVAASGSAQESDVATKLDNARNAMAALDFERAESLLRPLAESGNAQAQVGLGTLYSGGMGVAQDHEEAFVWFERSAEKGNPLGQYNLGISYYKGRGVKENPIEALKWVSLSAMQGFAPARQIHGSLSGSLGREDREEAKRRAREWKPR
jgi:TPR repeat protein